jgi:hypothetical protein
MVLTVVMVGGVYCEQIMNNRVRKRCRISVLVGLMALQKLNGVICHTAEEITFFIYRLDKIRYDKHQCSLNIIPGLKNSILL